MRKNLFVLVGLFVLVFGVIAENYVVTVFYSYSITERTQTGRRQTRRKTGTRDITISASNQNDAESRAEDAVKRSLISAGREHVSVYSTSCEAEKGICEPKDNDAGSSWLF